MPVSEKECIDLMDKAIDKIKEHVKEHHDGFLEPTTKIIEAIDSHSKLIKDAVCKKKD